MKGRIRGCFSDDLARGAEQFSRWRGSRSAGTRIPETLWQLALELGRRHGISRTAMALKVGYYCLKKRLANSVSSAAVAATVERGLVVSRPKFVELPFSEATSGECILEFEKPSGARLRMRFKGRELPDLAPLGRDFWEVG